MTATATDNLPISEIIEPASVDELAEAVREAATQGLAVYPLGGGTSLDFGLPARREGVGISLQNLQRIVDYPTRDMTITFEAGLTISQLAETLSGNGQWLPVDPPQPERATLGGVVATNFSGPHRYGYGTMRDFVIGIEAVNAQGAKFKGGGRVVKNVAGYDFCKLLTGSLGTLGVITQLTIKLKPLPRKSVLMACPVSLPDTAERFLSALVTTRARPVAIELVAGPVWETHDILGPLLKAHEATAAALIVGLEGTAAEVDSMQSQVRQEWQDLGARDVRSVAAEQVPQLWRDLADFPAGPSQLTLRAGVLASGVAAFLTAARRLHPDCSVRSDAGDGVVYMRHPEFPEEGLSRFLLAQLEPIATAHYGNIVVLSNPSGAEMTHQAVWGGIGAPFHLMTRIKKEFDPDNVFNPGRFVYV